jgi:hypothetical protein
MLSQVRQVAHRTEDRDGALRDLKAKFSEHWRARAPLDQLDAEKPFQLVDLHRKSRLADTTLRRGSSEMLMTGKRIEITQLPGRDHPDKIFLTPLQSNLIGILAPAKKNGFEAER